MQFFLWKKAGLGFALCYVALICLSECLGSLSCLSLSLEFGVNSIQKYCMVWNHRGEVQLVIGAIALKRCTRIPIDNICHIVFEQQYDVAQTATVCMTAYWTNIYSIQPYRFTHRLNTTDVHLSFFPLTQCRILYVINHKRVSKVVRRPADRWIVFTRVVTSKIG